MLGSDYTAFPPVVIGHVRLCWVMSCYFKDEKQMRLHIDQSLFAVFNYVCDVIVK